MPSTPVVKVGAMRIFIPTYNRATAITVHRWLGDELDYTICVHTQAERRAYTANPTIDPSKLTVTDAPIGMIPARQWILDQVPVGEWFLMLDDNVRGFTALDEPWYSDALSVPYEARGPFGRTGGRWSRVLTPHDLLNALQRDIAWAEPRGSHLIGFDVSGNPMFRQRKYSEFSYVCGKAEAVKRSHLNYDPDMLMMDDLDWTAQNLYAFGRTTVNRWIFPLANHWENGGLGPRASRMGAHAHDTVHLMRRWPGLFRFVSRNGDPEWAALQVKLSTQASIERWRATMHQQEGTSDVPARATI